MSLAKQQHHCSFLSLKENIGALLKTLLLYLNKYPIGMMPDLDIDPTLQEELDKI